MSEDTKLICIHRNYKSLEYLGKFSLYKCDTCNLIFTNKFLDQIDSRVLYEKFYKNETAARFDFGIEYIIRVFRFFRAFKIATIYPRAKKILDIGSGRGFMLYYLKKYYKFQRTAGTQISKNAFEFSRNKLGLEIYDKDLLELSLKKNSFDIITIWHVLEHVTDPEQYISKIFDLLNNKGKVVIEVPNFNSWTRALTHKYWLGLELDYHLTFFTPQTLAAMLKKHNFKIRLLQTFSLEYSTFISAQSLISLITNTDNIFFQSLQAGRFNPKTIFHLFLFILFTPVCFLANVLLYFSKKGEIVLIVGEKCGIFNDDRK